MSQFAVFLDGGEVVNYNGTRGGELQGLVAKYLDPGLGGSQIDWREATSKLNARQRRIRDPVGDGRIEFREFRLE